MRKKSKSLQPANQPPLVKEVVAYEYAAKRKNNPAIGLVTPDTDPGDLFMDIDDPARESLKVINLE